MPKVFANLRKVANAVILKRTRIVRLEKAKDCSSATTVRMTSPFISNVFKIHYRVQQQIFDDLLAIFKFSCVGNNEIIFMIRY